MAARSVLNGPRFLSECDTNVARSISIQLAIGRLVYARRTIGNILIEFTCRNFLTF